jgi:GNAT superfamily N-acetyltransferase
MWAEMEGTSLYHELNVTYAAPEHCPELGRIMAESFRSAFADFISGKTLDENAVPENCAGLIGSILTEMGVLTGWVDGKLMGLLVFAEHPDGRTEVEAIHSLRESWGTGLGAAMLEFALEACDGCRGAGLWAFEKNARARRFYEKHGFAFTGETRISEFDGAVEVRYERKFL